MEAKDREVWVGKCRLYLGEDNILYITVVGNVDEKLAIRIKEVDLKLRNTGGEKIHSLIDLNKAGEPSSKARKIGGEIFEHKKTGKVAIFGMHPVARVISSFVIGATKKKDIRFFKSREESLTWLKE